MSQWIQDGEPPVDVTGMHPDRLLPFMKNRSFRKERTAELLGDLFGDSSFPTWKPRYARDVRRSVIHDRKRCFEFDQVAVGNFKLPLCEGQALMSSQPRHGASTLDMRDGAPPWRWRRNAGGGVTA